jgi:hypothetical protein
MTGSVWGVMIVCLLVAGCAAKAPARPYMLTSRECYVLRATEVASKETNARCFIQDLVKGAVERHYLSAPSAP